MFKLGCWTRCCSNNKSYPLIPALIWIIITLPAYIANVKSSDILSENTGRTSVTLFSAIWTPF